ncbi:MAG TPA: NAD(P) transhydrogenase subunit alpha [Candidatus Tripitaka californicus]|uniref:NAD(P) transhydrogenase subunit alpha n=1 Tax=Candidatus Tripitaka californicus TaxID=3367616 RepID=UPI0040294C9F
MTGPLLISLYIFVLAIFVGFEVITKVPPLLHTPLMSGANAISGITVVGALISAGAGHSGISTLLGLIAVTLATINVVGGFLVTDRMLEMFKKEGRGDQPVAPTI